MRNLVIAAAVGCLLLAASQNPAAAQTVWSRCPVPIGSQRTLTGKMDETPKRGRDGKGWVLDVTDALSVEGAVGNERLCFVDFMRGNGPPPAQCGRGSRFTAKGRVVENRRGDIDILAGSIRCS